MGGGGGGGGLVCKNRKHVRGSGRERVPRGSRDSPIAFWTARYPTEVRNVHDSLGVFSVLNRWEWEGFDRRVHKRSRWRFRMERCSIRFEEVFTYCGSCLLVSFVSFFFCSWKEYRQCIFTFTFEGSFVFWNKLRISFVIIFAWFIRQISRDDRKLIRVPFRVYFPSDSIVLRFLLDFSPLNPSFFLLRGWRIDLVRKKKKKISWIAGEGNRTIIFQLRR